VPYLLDVQSDLLDSLATRVVIPLIEASKSNTPITRLNPIFEIEGTNVVLSTQELAGVPNSVLGAFVSSLREYRGDIVNALDLLLTGV
jgi:toxin CcdB